MVGFTNVQTLYRGRDKAHHMRIAVFFFFFFDCSAIIREHHIIPPFAVRLLISDLPAVSSVSTRIYFYEIQ